MTKLVLLIALALGALAQAASAAPVRIGAGEDPAVLYAGDTAQVAYAIDETTVGFCALKRGAAGCETSLSDLKVPDNEAHYGPLDPDIVQVGDVSVIVRFYENHAVWAWYRTADGVVSDADGNPANGHQATKLYSEGPRGTVREPVVWSVNGRPVLVVVWTDADGHPVVMTPQLGGADAARFATTTLPATGGAEVQLAPPNLVMTLASEGSVATSVLGAGQDPAVAANWSAPATIASGRHLIDPAGGSAAVVVQRNTNDAPPNELQFIDSQGRADGGLIPSTTHTNDALAYRVGDLAVVATSWLGDSRVTLTATERGRSAFGPVADYPTGDDVDDLAMGWQTADGALAWETRDKEIFADIVPTPSRATPPVRHPTSRREVRRQGIWVRFPGGCVGGNTSFTMTAGGPHAKSATATAGRFSRRDQTKPIRLTLHLVGGEDTRYAVKVRRDGGRSPVTFAITVRTCRG